GPGLSPVGAVADHQAGVAGGERHPGRHLVEQSRALHVGGRRSWLSRPARLNRSAEAAAIERDEALPVALGARLVVDLALRESEAVMEPEIDFELALGPGVLEQSAQLAHHRPRRQIVDLGAGDISLALDLGEIEMGA